MAARGAAETGATIRISKAPDLKADKDRCKEFLRTFTSNGVTIYMDMLQDVANRKLRTIDIKMDDISNHKDADESFVQRVQTNTKRYLSLFSEAIDELLPPPSEDIAPQDEDDHEIHMRQRTAGDSENATENPDPKQHMPAEIKRFYEVHILVHANEKPRTLRDVKASHIGHLVKVRGIVTRCTDVKPLLQVAVYTCEVCGFEIYQEVNSRTFLPLTECPAAGCRTTNSKGRLVLQLRASKFLKFQEAKIQELSEHVPKGHTPRSMTVHIRGELTRLVGPGDTIEISGIFLPTPYTGFRAIRAGLVADRPCSSPKRRNVMKNTHLLEPSRIKLKNFLKTRKYITDLLSRLPRRYLGTKM